MDPSTVSHRVACFRVSCFFLVCVTLGQTSFTQIVPDDQLTDVHWIIHGTFPELAGVKQGIPVPQRNSPHFSTTRIPENGKRSSLAEIPPHRRYDRDPSIPRAGIRRPMLADRQHSMGRMSKSGFVQSQGDTLQPEWMRYYATGLPGGVYLLRMQTGEFSETKRLVLLR